MTSTTHSLATLSAFLAHPPSQISHYAPTPQLCSSFLYSRMSMIAYRMCFGNSHRCDLSVSFSCHRTLSDRDRASPRVLRPSYPRNNSARTCVCIRRVRVASALPDALVSRSFTEVTLRVPLL